ncbi:hypothetical protein OG455_28840 [Kitasatospora sp. NBC_01287]|uniref:hypothetical protein n=1 Tax=Kitasatospora sp. NBC_01287 TaxID=2903573 RepID=UPI00225AA774|nr:hypothetical protein [Kitasatospora sp. NBC_01287]MCX4749471.1 hypothetical protein [Kitasatospora sp. NBC_01287]
MRSTWTTVLFSTAVAGAVAATTGIAAGSAVRHHPMIKPEAAESAPASPVPAVGSAPVTSADARRAARTVAALGALGGVLERVGDLAAVSNPGGAAGTAADPAADPAALRGRLGELGAAADKLKAALPAAPVLPVAPGAPSAPGAPALPSGVQPGGPLQRAQAPSADSAVEDRLGVLQQDAAAFVGAASAARPDPAAVQAALAPLSADSLALSTATVARLGAA